MKEGNPPTLFQKSPETLLVEIKKQLSHPPRLCLLGKKGHLGEWEAFWQGGQEAKRGVRVPQACSEEGASHRQAGCPGPILFIKFYFIHQIYMAAYLMQK